MTDNIIKQNVVMDATLLSSLQTCEQKLQYRHGLNIKPNKGKSKSLEMGSLVHVILENFYKSILNKKSRLESISNGLAAGEFYYTHGELLTNEVINDDGMITPATYEPLTAIEIDDYKLILETVDLYFKRWENDSFVPVFVEHVIGKVIYEDESLRVLWKAKFDLVVDTNDGLMSMDHKTTARKSEYLRLNNQFMGQCILTETRSVLINIIGFQTSLKPNERFTREVKSYTADQLAEWMSEVVYWSRYLIALNETNYYPRRLTQCKTGYGKCDYYENLCDVNPSMRSENIKLYFKPAKEWDVVND